MHMSDALLSPSVGAAMCVVSAAAIGYSITKIKKDELSEKKLPLMAVSGAFVFAAQMINFTIPVTGSSGHIGGGILLAAMLGRFPALLTLAAVLIIQCLFFADGGLLALGCNIFNMGVIPCLIIYPLIFRPLAKKLTNGHITAASVISVVAALQLGAFSVVLETLASGITELPFTAFVALMQPIHLAIGVVEGIVTAAVLCFVKNVRPEILENSGGTLQGNFSVKKIVAVMACMTVIVGGALSYLASSYPDGLEWSMENVAGTAELEAEGGVFDIAATIQEATAFMPDYEFKESDSAAGTGTAGIVGSAVTFALAGGAGLAISMVKRKKNAGGHE